MEFDYNRAGMLLTIVEKIAGVAPQMTAISGEAMRELREMNQAFADEGVRKAQARKEAEANKGLKVETPGQPYTPEPIKATEDQSGYRPTPLDQAIGTEAPETGANEPIINRRT